MTSSILMESEWFLNGSFWLIDRRIGFKRMLTRLGLFMSWGKGNPFNVRSYLYFICDCFLKGFLSFFYRKSYRIRIIVKQIYSPIDGAIYRFYLCGLEWTWE